MLKISNLDKSFDDKKVIDDLSIEIKDSSIFGLVGENGAGKSTLLRCISGIYKPENGKITLDDKDTYLKANVRKDIFFVSDDIYFPHAANINSMYTFYSSFYDIDKTKFDAYITEFKLDKKKQINTFSKGMKRQVGLCFALAIKPKLLLLDEAFDGLDPLVRFDLRKILSDFIEDNHSIIIISSHNLKELEDICDSFGILEEGKIKTYGDLLESKANINKYLLAFKEEIDENLFIDFDVLFKNKEGTIYTLVIKGDKEEITKKLKKFKPAVLNTLPVNFEELFIYEKGVK